MSEHISTPCSLFGPKLHNCNHESCYPLPATYYCHRKRKLTIISFFYGWHQKKLWWSLGKLQPTHWTFVTPFHFMLVGYTNYLYCFALYIQQLIGHSFYMLCWNCHMWIFSPWFFSIEYFGKMILIEMHR